MSATTTTQQEAAEVVAMTNLFDSDVITSALTGGNIPSLSTTDLPEPLIEDSFSDSRENPAGWLTGHRRIPNYRQGRVHPRWRYLTSSVREELVIQLMFRGCQLLQVSPIYRMLTREVLRIVGIQYASWLPRAIGFESHDYFVYQIAGEW